MEEGVKVEDGLRSPFFKTEVFGEESTSCKTEDVDFGGASTSDIQAASVSVKMEEDVQDSPVHFKTEHMFGMPGVMERGVCQTPMSIASTATLATPIQSVARDMFMTPLSSSFKTEEMVDTPMSLTFNPLLGTPMPSTPTPSTVNAIYQTPTSLKPEKTDHSTTSPMTNATPIAIEEDPYTPESTQSTCTPPPFPTRDIFATPVSDKTEEKEMVDSPMIEAFASHARSSTRDIYCTPMSVKTERRESFGRTTEETPGCAGEDDMSERGVSLGREGLRGGGLGGHVEAKGEELLDTLMEEDARHVATSSVVESSATFTSGPRASAVEGFLVHQDVENEDESNAWAAIPLPVFSDMKQEDNMI
ncbi:hypothetical protein BDV97DRAFT_356020 [Delphinella strobiligena]|nr:hypothetical protein BDV97DRAFT_356020 [Delphinella strobiligena]